jgi:2-isopropylmalate synthase
MSQIMLYDSTLRDGSQAEGVSFSLEDKLLVAQTLDGLGIHYIEGGFPFSNDKDMAFFREMEKRGLKTSKLCAFGSTRRAKMTVEEDPGLAALLAAGTPVVTLVGKSWDLHVRDVLRIKLEENVVMVGDSVKYMKDKGREVVYDAEHFYDGYKANPEHALATLKAALAAGADCLCLCDTNGGSLPSEIKEITATVAREVGGVLGFHGHNDSGCAVANTIAAVEGGATHVQGTINGLGERTGNADLCQVIPNLQIKTSNRCLPTEKLASLTEVSRLMFEIVNMPPVDGQPYVGRRAFAHKGGLHVDAVRKNTRTYEHISPEDVGNERRILLSELSGKATMLEKMEKYQLTSDKEVMKKALMEIQRLENLGYQFEAAEASFALMVRRMLGTEDKFFHMKGFRVITTKRNHDAHPVSEATIKVVVGEEEELVASEGDGPVSALNGALRKALDRFYPALREMHLLDYKVRIINPQAGTEARVRVVIEWRDHQDIWGTVGVSENLVEASWQAVVDSICYKLSKDKEKAELKK